MSSVTSSPKPHLVGRTTGTNPELVDLRHSSCRPFCPFQGAWRRVTSNNSLLRNRHRPQGMGVVRCLMTMVRMALPSSRGNGNVEDVPSLSDERFLLLFKVPSGVKWCLLGDKVTRRLLKALRKAYVRKNGQNLEPSRDLHQILMPFNHT